MAMLHNEEHICVVNREYDISELYDELSDSSIAMKEPVDEMISYSSGTVSRPVDEMAIQIFVEPGTKDRQCRAYVKDKGRQCVRTAIGNNIYCCAHFSNKKERRLKVIPPICGGITFAGNKCKYRSRPGFSFCKRHWHKAETGQTSNLNRCTLKRRAEENCSGSQNPICKDLVLAHPESPLEINPVSVMNDVDPFFAKNILGETLKLSGNDHNEDSCIDNENAVKCKVCFEEFPDNQTLGNHWMESHEKEAQWLFRGYACAFCFQSFTNKKLLESHVQKRHYAQFGEHCLLFICIPCGCHFGNMEELWLHVKSVHPAEFKLSKAPELLTLATGDDSPEMIKQANKASLDNNNSENPSGSRKLSCRFFGLKFDLLPELGRHHQAAHMERNLASRRLAKSGVRYYAHRVKSGRLSRPKFKRSLEEASNRIRRRAKANFKKRNLNANRIRSRAKVSNKLLERGEISIQHHVNEITSIAGLEESQCLEAANILFSDILSLAFTACCKGNLEASLKEKYGYLPERLYLKAAKLRSEKELCGNWHQDEFICPRGCTAQNPVSPLASLSNDHLKEKLGSSQKALVLCNDISFAAESTPVICVVDLQVLNYLCEQQQERYVDLPKPWEMFTYVTKPMLDRLPSLDCEDLQLYCDCSSSTCCPETCDRVYPFGDEKHIFWKPMAGRFAYDVNGRIILEEGKIVFECNSKCGCNKTCANRILQNGVRVKLEVFMTEKKGFGVRAGEAILRGTFVCEYIGEVLQQQEAHNRHRSKQNCSYFLDIDAHANHMSRLVEGQPRYVIDSTTYGNVSRFINNSCSPNLVDYKVLVEGTDCKHTHIGLYASRDIALGEELTYNYHYELVPGEVSPCRCGSLKC